MIIYIIFETDDIGQAEIYKICGTRHIGERIKAEAEARPDKKGKSFSIWAESVITE